MVNQIKTLCLSWMCLRSPFVLFTCKEKDSWTLPKSLLVIDPVTDKTEHLMPEWIDECIKYCVLASYLYLRRSWSVFFTSWNRKHWMMMMKVEFTGSSGWFDWFLRWGQLQSLKVTGKSASAVAEVAEKFPEELKKIITEDDYLYKEVFNCDQTKIYWKKLLSKTFILIEEEQAKRHKALKDQFTLMPIINATGDVFLKPLLVYHSENLRALKGINKKT